ncbi:MAG: hypothetical protein JXR94_18665 [Candidatus Hydrogenedentes bacterium]|nr:hypothetical protein [Candidatus Hydrogenedentota bacterium]
MPERRIEEHESVGGLFCGIMVLMAHALPMAFVAGRGSMPALVALLLFAFGAACLVRWFAPSNRRKAAYAATAFYGTVCATWAAVLAYALRRYGVPPQLTGTDLLWNCVYVTVYLGFVLFAALHPFYAALSDALGPRRPDAEEPAPCPR